MSEIIDNKFIGEVNQKMAGDCMEDVSEVKKNLVRTNKIISVNDLSKEDKRVNDRDAEEFEISPKFTKIGVGMSVIMSAIAKPTANQPLPNDPRVVWESSDETIANITEGNVVNFIKVGEVTISATDSENPETAPVSMSVNVVSLEDADIPDPYEGTYEYIFDENSWNTYYNNTSSALRLYHDAYPDEDRWNDDQNRRAYVPEDKVNDEWPDYCYKCWKGAINSPGAKYPWAVVELPIPFEGTIKFSYEGKDDVYPWGEEMRKFSKGFGVASIPTELGDEFLLDGNGDTTFDTSKFTVTLIPGKVK